MCSVYAYLGGSERIEALFAESSNLFVLGSMCDTIGSMFTKDAPVELSRGKGISCFYSNHRVHTVFT